MSAETGHYGFHTGEHASGLIWLRNPQGRYTRISPELRALLYELRAGPPGARLDEEARQAIAQLEDGGYLWPGGELIEEPEHDDIRLAPRLGALVVLWLVLGAIVWQRAEVAWPPPADPWVNLWALPFFACAALLHEFGHWAACRPYFRPAIRVGLLNGVFPALVTMTNDAWRLPRKTRIWINLAGPLVDVALTLVLAVAHLVWFPQVQVFSTLILVQFLRIVFVFNPLIEGDGYWCLVDALGVINLRSRGWSDLKRGAWTRYALYTASAIVFTVLSLALYVRVGLRAFGIV